MPGGIAEPRPTDTPPREDARPLRSGGSALLLLTALVGCGGQSAESPEDLALRETARALFGQLEPPSAERLASPEFALGRRLFWDERISLDGQTACASCHTADAWAADARRFSEEARGELTSRNSQTIFNAMRQPRLRWLADRQDGADQAERSIVGSMGFSDAADVVALLTEHGYGPPFQAAFPTDANPISPRNYGLALQAYQETLVTPAPFDAYLGGDAEALTSDEKEGLRLFVSTGCAGCHNGPLLGGQLLQRFGVVQDYWTATGSEEVDPGRFAMTGDEADRYVFRVAMLRNIARTAPYFHDGSVATLRDAVGVMARVQLGRDLSETDAGHIGAFLESLTGEVPAHYSPPENWARPSPFAGSAAP